MERETARRGAYGSLAGAVAFVAGVVVTWLCFAPGAEDRVIAVEEWTTPVIAAQAGSDEPAYGTLQLMEQTFDGFTLPSEWAIAVWQFHDGHLADVAGEIVIEDGTPLEAGTAETLTMAGSGVGTVTVLAALAIGVAVAVLVHRFQPATRRDAAVLGASVVPGYAALAAGSALAFQWETAGPIGVESALHFGPALGSAVLWTGIVVPLVAGVVAAVAIHRFALHERASLSAIRSATAADGPGLWNRTRLLVGSLAGVGAFLAGLLGTRVLHDAPAETQYTLFRAQPGDGAAAEPVPYRSLDALNSLGQEPGATGSIPVPSRLQVTSWLHQEAHFVSGGGQQTIGQPGAGPEALSLAAEPSTLVQLLPVLAIVAAAYLLSRVFAPSAREDAVVTGLSLVPGYALASVATASYYALEGTVRVQEERTGGTESAVYSVDYAVPAFDALAISGAVYPAVVAGAAGAVLFTLTGSAPTSAPSADADA